MNQLILVLSASLLSLNAFAADVVPRAELVRTLTSRYLPMPSYERVTGKLPNGKACMLTVRGHERYLEMFLERTTSVFESPNAASFHLSGLDRSEFDRAGTVTSVVENDERTSIEVTYEVLSFNYFGGDRRWREKILKVELLDEVDLAGHPRRRVSVLNPGRIPGMGGYQVEGCVVAY